MEKQPRKRDSDWEKKEKTLLPADSKRLEELKRKMAETYMRNYQRIYFNRSDSDGQETEEI